MENIKITRTNSQSTDFQGLIKLLDAYLSGVNGEKDDFFRQFNKIDMLDYVVVAYQNGEAIACGAIKPFSDDAMEVKRMYVVLEQRGRGIAQKVLNELEKWAQELGFAYCVLETSYSMTDAVGLYQKCGYETIDRYGQYAAIETSVCFRKELLTN